MISSSIVMLIGYLLTRLYLSRKSLGHYSFNGSFRRGVLDMYVFRTLTEVRERTDDWLRQYNEEIARESLGMLTPVEYRLKHAPETANYAWH
ncbi:MAG: transposase [Pseudomonadales bacterium]|nr:transposase [Pseudomonadales bacterium]